MTVIAEGLMSLFTSAEKPQAAPPPAEPVAPAQEAIPEASPIPSLYQFGDPPFLFIDTQADEQRLILPTRRFIAPRVGEKLNECPLLTAAEVESLFKSKNIVFFFAVGPERQITKISHQINASGSIMAVKELRKMAGAYYIKDYQDKWKVFARQGDETPLCALFDVYWDTQDWELHLAKAGRSR